VIFIEANSPCVARQRSDARLARHSIDFTRLFVNLPRFGHGMKTPREKFFVEGVSPPITALSLKTP
jgi:hypothetical protein